MNHISKLEKALDVKLPKWYISNFCKIETVKANSPEILIDPNDVIEITSQYRNGFAGSPRWPKDYIFVGDDGAASIYVINISDQKPVVYLFDHGDWNQVIDKIEDVSSWVIENQMNTEVKTGQMPSRLVIIAIVVGVLMLLSGLVSFLISLFR